MKALQDFAARAYRRPLTQAERDDLLAYYRELREKDGLSHEDAMRDPGRQCSDVAGFLLPDQYAGSRGKPVARVSRRLPTTRWPAA